MQYKKQIILSILTIFVLSALIIGATFSYFQAQGDTSSQTSATVKTYTTDVFSFETGDAISFSLNQENFTSGKGNQIGSTFAKTILTANNKTNTATEHYYLYLNISNNTFTYTQNENTPEILLTITDGTNPVTNLTSLTYKTVTDGKGNRISGYDITNKKGLITLFSNREITTTSTKTENWNITVTFINYNLDQSKNAGHTFSGKLMIQKEKIKETVATVCSSGQTLSSCIIAMNGKDDTLYYHDSSLTNGAGDNSYRYAGGDYQLTNKATETTANLVKFYCDEKESTVGSGCNGEYYYALQYETSNNKYSTYNEALEKAVEDGYLTKDNVKNFVCFGSTATPCPTENLYRIIGVFNANYHNIDDKFLVKLVKYNSASSDLLGTNGDYYGNIEPTREGYKEQANGALSGYYWNYKATDSATNIWSTSLLNKTNLNTNYLNNIGTFWANKIAMTTWKVGGNAFQNISGQIASVAYQNEIVSPSENTTYAAKVGLMYVTDYAFAYAPTYWTINIGDYKEDDNWLDRGTLIWYITRNSSSVDKVYWSSDSLVFSSETSKSFPIYPTFLLTSTTTYDSGTGTMSNPIRIK